MPNQLVFIQRIESLFHKYLKILSRLRQSRLIIQGIAKLSAWQYDHEGEFALFN